MTDVVAIQLVQAAVAGSALSMRFDVGARDFNVKIHFPERVKNEAMVQACLAEAFATAHSLGPAILSWECSGRTQSLAGLPDPEPEFDLRGPSLFQFILPTSFLAELNPSEIDLLILHERCALCPLPVFLSGSRVNRPLEPGVQRAACEVVQLASRDLPVYQRFLAPTPQWLGFGVVDLNERTYRSTPVYDQTVLILEGAGEPEIVTHSEPSPRGTTIAREAEAVQTLTSFHVATKQRTDWVNSAAYLSLDAADDPCFFAQRRILLSRGQHTSVLRPILNGVSLEEIPLPGCRPGCRIIQTMPEIPLNQWQRQMDTELERLMEVWMSVK